MANVEALNHLHYLNPTRDGAPELALFEIRLTGAFSEGAQDILNRFAELIFLTLLNPGNFSYLVARQRWIDWWMRIFQRNILNSVAKSVVSGSRICNNTTP